MYLSLFLSALLAATILPAQSEAVLAYHLSTLPEAWGVLVAVATLGNVLGAVVNWGLGGFVTRAFIGTSLVPGQSTEAEQCGRALSEIRAIFPVAQLGTGHWRSNHGGRGVLREPLWSFLLLVTIAKSSRYIAIAMVVSKVV